MFARTESEILYIDVRPVTQHKASVFLENSTNIVLLQLPYSTFIFTFYGVPITDV